MSKRRRAVAPLPPPSPPMNDIESARARADAAVSSLERRTDAELALLRLEQKLDRWVNQATGLGTLDDKTRASHFEPPWRLSDVEITSLASGNDLAAKCIEKRPDEMFRRGYVLEGQQPGEVDKSQIDDAMQYANDELLADVRLQEGMQYGRQYGGSILILGINDGRQPDEPVDEDNIESIDFINQIDRRFAYVQSYYSDYQKPMFGQAETYLVANGVATSSYRSADGSSFGYRKKTPAQIKRSNPQSTILNIHESRIIRFDGIMPDLITRQTLAGWSWSVLQRPYEILRMCDGSFDALAYLLSDASQGVLKLKGLFNAISAGKEQKLQQRLELMEKTRSVMRSIALDAGGDEDFTRVTTPMTGIPDAIDRIMQRLAAAMDMPVTELFGISPAGLNATGESDRIKWYDTIATEQSKHLAPKIKRLYKLISLAKSGPFKGKGADFKVKFHPLYSPTDDELAATRLKNAQRDEIYVTMEAVTAEQVALTLTEVYPSIDPEEVEAAVEEKTKFDPYENDENESAEAQAKAGGANGSLPEQQSPTVPLPGSQQNATAGAPAGEGSGTPSGPNTGNPRGKPPTQTKHSIEVKVSGPAPAKAKKTGADRKDPPFTRKDFDPDQPRDEDGKFAGGSGGGSSSSHSAAAHETSTHAPPAASPAHEAAPDGGPHGIHEANPQTFKSAFDHAFAGSPFTNHVSHYSEDDLGKMKTFLTHDGKAGIAVHDHGDGRVEGTALFNQGAAKGAGRALLEHAVTHAGVNYLECYGEGLRKLYESAGFKVETSSPFNPEYAAPTWDYGKFGKPNYYTLRRP